MNQRISEKLRVISMLSIFLVVCLHAYNLEKAPDLKNSFVWFFENYISNGLTRIAVPIFFIISGYFFFKDFENKFDFYTNMLLKKIRTLFIPFLFWSLLGILIYFILQSIPLFSTFFTKKLIKEYTFFEILETIFVTPIPYQLWFMRDLMIFILVSPIISYILKKAPIFVLSLNLILWVIILNKFQNSIEAFLFFTLGGMMSIYKPEIFSLDFSKSKKIFILFWVSLCLFKVFLDFYNFSDILIRLIHKASILVGIIAFWSIYDFIRMDYLEKKQFKSLVQYTFFIYAFHEPLLTIIKKLLFSVLGKAPLCYGYVYILSIFLTLSISLFVGYSFKTVFIKLYIKVTGGR